MSFDKEGQVWAALALSAKGFARDATKA